MSTQSKNRILILAVAFLLLINIGMLVYFLFFNAPAKRGKHGGREAMMTEFLQKDIGFGQQQLQQYDTLSKAHREKMKALFEEAGMNKESQMKQLAGAGFSDSAINEIAAQSAEKQRLLEVRMFQYLREVRRICTPVQLPKFDSLFQKVMGRHGGPGKKPGDNK